MKSKNKKKINHILHLKIIKWGIIPMFFVCLWAFLTFLYIIRLDTTFSILSYNLPKDIFSSLPSGKILKGDYILGSFLAKENNLGIISIRFTTFFRPTFKDEDLLLFQLKERGSKKILYESTYRVGTIYDVPYFPFGFPIISNSMGKEYEFKIMSLNGNPTNSVAPSYRNQIVTAKYKYSRSELLASNQALFNFILKKIEFAFKTTDILFSSTVYFLPLLFYLLLVAPIGKGVRRSMWANLSKFSDKNIAMGEKSYPLKFLICEMLLLLISAIDALYLQLGNGYVFLLVLVLWVLIQQHFQALVFKTFSIALGMFIFPIFLLIFDLTRMSELIVAWGYIFMTAAVLLILIRLKKKDDTII